MSNKPARIVAHVVEAEVIFKVKQTLYASSIDKARKSFKSGLGMEGVGVLLEDARDPAVTIKTIYRQDKTKKRARR